MKRFSLHLTTRCGCVRTIDNGSTPPPLEYVVMLERSLALPTPRVQALSMAGADQRIIDEVNEERLFRRTGYSGTPDFGTAFYKEV